MDDEKQTTVMTSEPLGIDLEKLSVINDLRERLTQITSEQIAVSTRRFKRVPKKAKIIGQVLETSTRALHALWMALDAEADLEAAKAGAAIHEQIETDHRERHALLEIMAGVAREMWWAQAKIDLGLLKCVGIAIYRDWMLVEDLRRSGPAGFIEMITGQQGGDGGEGDEE